MKLVPEDRSWYDLSDLIIYGECPARLSLYSNNAIESQETLLSSMVNMCFNYLTSKALSGKFPSRKSFDLEFNILWNSMKGNTTCDLSFERMILVRSMCDKVYKFFSSLKSFEVICHNQIFEYTTANKIIKIPLTILRQSATIHSIYLDTEVSYTKQKTMYPIAYTLIHEVTKNLLSGYNYARSPCIIRTQHFSIHAYRPIYNISNVIDDVVIALDNIRYPIIGNNCKICNKKSKCPWFNEQN